MPASNVTRCVVTGGAGFIGSSLVRSLLTEGHSVHVIDNLLTGNLDNLEDIAKEITVYEYDICDYDQVAPVISERLECFTLRRCPLCPNPFFIP